MFVMIFMWVQFSPLTYNTTYEHPAWAQAIGLSMAFSSMICIPAFCAVKLIMTPGTFKQRWWKCITPKLLHEQVPDHWPDRHLYIRGGFNAEKAELEKLNGRCFSPETGEAFIIDGLQCHQKSKTDSEEYISDSPTDSTLALKV